MYSSPPMNLTQLIKESTTWFGWLGLGLVGLTLISFIIGWKEKFRLVGATVFSLLLCASSWAFTESYTPPFTVEGAKYLPVVYDNGSNLVVAQAPANFPDEAIKPTLEQIAGNLKGGGRSGGIVKVRIRKLEPAGADVSRPKVLGEVLRDLRQDITISTQQTNKTNETS